ncbi:hypothetical protein [Streptomyces gobiensis]|uniref:hypothetical protein n=1 Tax=Streptomyces gobiensis TaxID=2875706 RepID=UPI001E475AB9|nr:hypothetical protein [Streptomyces gobiensis]UGY92384.1 hypothetical protein test1122_12045 [Streptomyces gobiensis]
MTMRMRRLRRLRRMHHMSHMSEPGSKQVPGADAHPPRPASGTAASSRSRELLPRPHTTALTTCDDEFGDRRSYQLSGGQLRRLGITDPPA